MTRPPLCAPGSAVQVTDSSGGRHPGVYREFVGFYRGEVEFGALHRVKLNKGPLVCVYQRQIIFDQQTERTEQ